MTPCTDSLRIDARHLTALLTGLTLLTGLQQASAQPGRTPLSQPPTQPAPTPPTVAPPAVAPEEGQPESGPGVANREAAVTAQNQLLCFAGRPAPACRVVLLGELGLRGGWMSDAGDESTRSFTADIGLLINIDARHSVGTTAGVRPLHPFAGAALLMRYRYWAAPGLRLDATAGLLVPRADLTEAGRTGSTVGGALNIGDYISFGLDLEVFDSGSGNQVAILGGVKVGTPLLWRVAWGAVQVVGALASPGDDDDDDDR